jgi:hypothetical protein
MLAPRKSANGGLWACRKTVESNGGRTFPSTSMICVRIRKVGEKCHDHSLLNGDLLFQSESIGDRLVGFMKTNLE